MPTSPYLDASWHPSYPPPRKYVLVLSCVDARLLDDLLRFLDRDNLTNRYYHVTLPGAALGLTKRVRKDLKISSDASPEEQRRKKELRRQFRRWRKTFIEQVQATVVLTKGELTDIYIIQHEDCGAFRVYINKDSAGMSMAEEADLHREYARALLKDLQENFCTDYNVRKTVNGQPGDWIQQKKPLIHTFFMSLRGLVSHFETCPECGQPEGCGSAHGAGE